MTDLTASVFARRLASVAVFTVVSALSAHAQQPGLAVNSVASLASVPTLDLSTASPAATTESLASSAGVTYSSSTDSVDPTDATLDAARANLTAVSPDGLQPPPRRSYGRPRYNDNSHNADGSSKYGFLAGVGLDLPVGDTYHYYNTSYAFQVGGIRNFNKNFGVALQFDWDEFGINSATLTNQSNLYNNILGCTPAEAAAGDCITGLDGNAHVWSFSLNPIYNIMQRDKYGAYLVVGAGYYHKVTNFTQPEEVSDGFFTFEENAIVDHYTSNAVGFSGGLGLTYKPSKFASERIYIEGRYVFVDNSQRPGVTLQNFATTTNNPNNEFPANSNRTGYIPIKVGVRF